MVVRTAIIVNKLGLHARPCAQLVSAATRYKSEVYLVKEEMRVNGKSIMGVMMLAAEKGSKIIVETDGPDEETALGELVKVIETGFDEDE